MRSLIIVALTLASLPIALTKRIGTSARCGPSFGLTCKDSKYGNCCSQYSYCGSTDSYCGTGCQNSFGDCKGVVNSPSIKSTFSTRTSSSNVPTSTEKVSTNARCGKEGAGATCLGTKWGSCCSQYSYCGSTIDYCGKDCQLGFGNCNSVSSSSKLSTRSSSPVSPSSSVAPSTTTTWTTGSAGLTVSVVTSSSLVEPSSTSSSSLEVVTSSTTPSPTSSPVESSSSLSTESFSTSSSFSSALPSSTPSVCIPTNEFCTIDTYVNCCSQCCYFPTGNTQAGQCC